jgi:hypothetical protein
VTQSSFTSIKTEYSKCRFVSERELGGESNRVERTTKFMFAAVNGTAAPNLIGIVSLGFQSRHVSQLFNRRELLDFLEVDKGHRSSPREEQLPLIVPWYSE